MEGQDGQHVLHGVADQGRELDSASDGPAYPVERLSGEPLALPYSARAAYQGREEVHV